MKKTVYACLPVMVFLGRKNRVPTGQGGRNAQPDSAKGICELMKQTEAGYSQFSQAPIERLATMGEPGIKSLAGLLKDGSTLVKHRAAPSRCVSGKRNLCTTTITKHE